MSWYFFKPYVSVAKRQADAAKEVAKLAKKGQVISPVKLNGTKIVTTFWGKSWCENLETYSDFASRLPRGRRYVRNGSVVDLQIKPGTISALVSGSDLYRIKITIKPLKAPHWQGIRDNCAGKIASVIELLKGKISEHVMKVVTNQTTGLFPGPAEIEMDCSCPDGATMCKHVAATMYGVGARLDRDPGLLFSLRQVDHLDLIANAMDAPVLTATTTGAKTINAENLSDVFGIELEEVPAAKSDATLTTTVKPKRHSTRKIAQKLPASAQSTKIVKGSKVTAAGKSAVKKAVKKRPPTKRKSKSQA